MKKRISFILTIFMMVCLSACGSTSSKKESDGAKEEPKFSYEISNQVFNIKENSIGSKHYDGIVEITNTGNVPIYLNSCKYDFEDADGHLVKSDDSVECIPKVVEPGEKGYIYPFMDTIDDSVAETKGLQLKPDFKVDLVTDEYPVLEVSDVAVRMESMGNDKYPVVTGRIKNNTSKDISTPEIAVVFFDDKGVPFGIDKTYGSEVKVGEQSSFEISCSMSEFLSNHPESDYENYKIFAVDSFYFQSGY